MDLKLTNTEAVAVMTALQHYEKEVEKMTKDKGVQIAGNTIRGLISRIESMPAGEVPPDLKLANSEAVAILTALQHYEKEVEKMTKDKGVQIGKKTVRGLISRLESMPAGEVQ